MLQSELIDLAKTICSRKAESQTTEVKSAHFGCPEKLYSTLSSFSNQDSGGIIVFGIDEKAGFDPVGVYDVQDLQKTVSEQCRQMHPVVRAVFTHAVFEGGVICSAEIPAIDLAERPCYYEGAGSLRGSWIRVGESDEHMTDYELYNYEAFRRHQKDDERPVERASLSALQEARLKDYVDSRKAERPGLAAMPEDMIYEMLNVLRNGTPTIAAVMNFGIYPQGYLPQMAITAIAVPGEELGETDDDGVRFLDNKRIEGTIDSMVEEAVNFALRNMKVKTVIDEKTGRRNDRPEYPVRAVREALLNAVIHRDYSIHTEGTPVQLLMFSNRMEIHSPGSLYGRMSIEQLGVAKPDLRNAALALMTESMTQAENRYSGIPTMRREMASYHLPPPVFENRRNEFVVTFYNHAGQSWVSGHTVMPERKKDTADLLAFCRIPRTRQEIASFLGLKTQYYVNAFYIKPLLEQGALRMTIPEKPASKYQKFVATQQGDI